MVKKLKQMADKKAASASSFAGGVFDSALAASWIAKVKQIPADLKHLVEQPTP